MQIIDTATEVKASVNTLTLMSSSKMRAGQAFSISYSIKNTGANSISWEVRGGNSLDLSDAIVVQSLATITAGSSSSYASTVPVYAYYAIYIRSTVADNHGEATIKGITKG